jgi:hypothetical protein
MKFGRGVCRSVSSGTSGWREREVREEEGDPEKGVEARCEAAGDGSREENVAGDGSRDEAGVLFVEGMDRNESSSRAGPGRASASKLVVSASESPL